MKIGRILHVLCGFVCILVLSLDVARVNVTRWNIYVNTLINLVFFDGLL